MSSQPETEFVESSDVEEQELQAADSTQYWGVPTSSPGREPPRKKPKLFHEYPPSTPASTDVHAATNAEDAHVFSSPLSEPGDELDPFSPPYQPLTPPRAISNSPLPLTTETIAPRIPITNYITSPPSSPSFARPLDHLITSSTSLNTPDTQNDFSHSNDTHTTTDTYEYPLQEMQPNGRQYSLRTRAPRQLNPYQFDAALYKQQMRAAPEAIIKLRHIEQDSREVRRRDKDYQETQDAYDESQDILEPVQNDAGATSNHRHHNAASHLVREGRSLPAVLKELSDSEEEDGETKALRREARKAEKLKKLKEQQQKQKQLELAQNTKRIRRLPLDASLDHDHMLDINDTNSSQIVLGDSSTSTSKEPLRRSSSTPGLSQSNGNSNLSSDWPADVYNTDIHEPPPSPVTSEPGSTPTSPSKTLPDPLKSLGRGGKLLKRMYPAVMLAQMMRPSQHQKRRSRSHSSASIGEEEEEELRPGQSRRRRVLGEIADVRGDSESSEEERNSPSPSLSPSPPSHRRTKKAAYRRDFIDLTADADEEEAPTDLSSDAISDGEIDVFLKRDHAASRTRFDIGSGIDYMLSRTRFVGGNRNQRSKKSTKSMSRHKTKDAKRLVQTDLLTYGYYHDSRSANGRLTPNSNVLSRTERSGTESTQSKKRNYRDVSEGRGWSESGLATTKPEDKEKGKDDKDSRKQRRRKASQKLYTFANGDTVTVSRHRVRDYVTIDFEDEEQQSILINHTFEPKAAPSRSSGKPHSVPARNNAFFREERSSNIGNKLSNKYRLTTTMDISPITTAIRFGGDTYIGRGYLRELTRLLRDKAQKPASPSSYGAFGIEINSETTPTQLIASLSELWDCILTDISTSFGEDETTEPRSKHWQGLIHACCQRVSWTLTELPTEEAISFREALIMQMIGFISRLENTLSNSSTPVTHQKLTAGWFGVEVFARLGCNLSAIPADGVEINPLRRAIVCLMKQLLSHGLDKSIRPLEDHGETSIDLLSDTVDQHSLEALVCILHVVRSHSADGSSENRLSSTDYDHPISSLILEAMSPEEDLPENHFRVSESAWISAFALSKLGQISEHGLFVSDLHLEPAWGLVSKALDIIRLVATPDKESSQSDHRLATRDGLIHIILSRFRRLWTVWKWDFSGAFSVLKQLSGIFRSRLYSGLIGDRAEFPDFVREHDVSLLTTFEDKEGAFATFLKLLVRSERGMREDSDFTHLGSNHRKILTLAIPSSALPDTKGTTPTDNTLSMIINRFSALAMAICLDPKAFDRRVQQAREYVQFKQSDHTTQITCIRGAMYLGLLAISLDISAAPALRWLSDIINDLLDMSDLFHDATHSSNSNKTSPGNVSAVVVTALGAVIRCMRSLSSQSNARWDAAPFSEGWVQRLAKSVYINIPGIRSAFSLLVLAFLNAFPETQLNNLSTINDESQGYESFSFDEDELQEALGEDSELVRHKLAAKKDLIAVAYEYLDQAVFRLACQEFKRDHISIYETDRWMTGVETWIECWTRLANLAVQSGKRSWVAYLNFRSDTWGKIQHEIRRRKVELYLLTCILRLDRNAYQPTGRFFIVFLESLTTHEVTIEPNYCSLVLKIDNIKHPLLSGLGNGEAILAESFPPRRKEILETIFFHLSNRLQHQSVNEAGDNRKYLAEVVKMFQSMTEVHSRLEQAQQSDYAHFYNEILSCAIRYPTLQHSPNLQRWIQWGKEHV